MRGACKRANKIEFGREMLGDRGKKLRLGGLLFAFTLFVIPVWAFPQGVRVQCEVLDARGPSKAYRGELKDIRYILVHHAREQDRQRLSELLKGHSGEEVVFIFKGRRYRGVIFRLPYCFGRGLILHTTPLDIKRKDLIEVIFSGQEGP